ncbi:MAG: hypothetical protein JW959_05525 [Pirellulales bacterium]|nr:hypothetical protein [Pirellulales bacterium]
MRNIGELFILANSFGRYLLGKDYFHMKQGLGAYFTDPRCYYNDLRHKARWDGPYIDGVPALHLAATGRDVILPTMVLLHGLGNLDCYFLQDDASRLDGVHRVAEWMVRAILPEGYYDNHCRITSPAFEYYTNNSAMTQGLAISFATRAIRYELVDESLRSSLHGLSDRIVANMLLPAQRHGTSLHQGEDLYLLEFCRKDHNIVLNGWIFAVFGLIDYLQLVADDGVQAHLQATLGTMKRALPQYCLGNGWSCYDNMGRVSSPFYHDLHIALLDAMHRLTGEPEFEKYGKMFCGANRLFNRTRYTLRKIKDKLRDRDAL